MANPWQSLSILLVEDEKATLDLLANILSKKYPGVALFTAIDGRKGLELFNMHMADIVITDINMPGMSGVQMAEKIRAIKPDTKFIIVTGNTEKVSLKSSTGEGFAVDHFIKKPVNFDKFFAALEQSFGGIAKP